MRRQLALAQKIEAHNNNYYTSLLVLPSAGVLVITRH